MIRTLNHIITTRNDYNLNIKPSLMKSSGAKFSEISKKTTYPVVVALLLFFQIPPDSMALRSFMQYEPVLAHGPHVWHPWFKSFFELCLGQRFSKCGAHWMPFPCIPSSLSFSRRNREKLKLLILENIIGKQLQTVCKDLTRYFKLNEHTKTFGCLLLPFINVLLGEKH